MQQQHYSLSNKLEEQLASRSLDIVFSVPDIAGCPSLEPWRLSAFSCWKGVQDRSRIHVLSFEL